MRSESRGSSKQRPPPQMAPRAWQPPWPWLWMQGNPGGARLSPTCSTASAGAHAWKSLQQEQGRQLEVNNCRVKDKKAREMNIPDHFNSGTARDLDEEPAAEASKADNNAHYKWRWRAAGKGNRRMVQRPKLNSTCKMTTAGRDLGGARRDRADLKASRKGTNQVKTLSPCNQHRLKKDQMDKNPEKK